MRERESVVFFYFYLHQTTEISKLYTVARRLWVRVEMCQAFHALRARALGTSRNVSGV